MTAKGHLVLEDAERAVKNHTSELRGAELRISWVSIVTLLRAVGHVLVKVDKEDGSCDDALKKSIEDNWKNTMSEKPPIFTEFIDSERNGVIKLYEFGFKRYTEIEGPQLKDGKTRIFLDQVGSRGGGISTPNEAVQHSFIDKGPFAGRDESEVAAEAILWWKNQLASIEREANKYRQSDM